jgi:hypothetical protein
MSRPRLLVVAIALTLLTLSAATGTALALPAWSVLPAPPTQAAALQAVNAFGDTGVVVAGQGGKVAVSTDGGATWRQLPAAALTTSTLTGVAFSDAEHGVVVGQDGTILTGAPDDADGFTWAAASLDGAPADLKLRDVAMSGTMGFAVGDGGMILATDDAGATWTRQNAPTAADLTAVAISGDGAVAAAVGAQGTLLVRQRGRWEARDTTSTVQGADLRDVALPADSASGILYCCTSSKVVPIALGSTSPDPSPFPDLPAGVAARTLALVETRDGNRIVVGGKVGTDGWLGGVSTSGAAWAGQTIKGASSATSLATAGPVCYATTAAGAVERALNAGRTYVVSLKVSPATTGGSTYKAILTAGGRLSLNGNTTALAPGVLFVQARPANATSWKTVGIADPGETKVAAGDSPTMNTTYRVRFFFAGKPAATSSQARVGVRRKVTVSATSLSRRLHQTYRVRGSVAPKAPAGRYVTVWTDRVANHRLGKWHRISLGGIVRLVNGQTFTTRLFGTPVRETYHLQIRIPADKRHLAGRSALITVTVR